MRTSTQQRKTKETDITLELSIDAPEKPEVDINTGIGFFDHMLISFATHGGFGLKLNCAGDLQVDGHHTVEDCGIVQGKAIAKALGDRSGIARFGSFFVPMDEALAFCAVDVSGRPFLVFDAVFDEETAGDYATCLTEEFFRAVAFHAGLTLHIKLEYGGNAHHATEAVFKAAAHALRLAVKQTGGEVLSTKGSLAD